MAEQLLRPMLASSATRCKELTRLALVLLIGVPLTSNAAKVPAHFQSYATTNVGGGLSCVVGATSDSEHSNERAYVYIEDSKTHTLRWIASIPLHAGWYQNRASHCVADGGAIYALIQSDTNATPVMSQTLISIAKLDQGTGRIESNDLIKVTASVGAHTVFVYDGAENFRSDAGKLVVTGEYVSKSDPAEIRKPFTFAIPINNTLR